MLHDIVTKGSTDRSVTVKIIDSADGTPETGVVFNTSGIDLWYRREGAASVDITEATLSALTDAHSDGGFLHINDGVYRLDMPDAAFASGANYVDFGGTVTGMIVIGGRVRLIDANLEVANIAANMTQISGDSTAADNLETAFDDTPGAVPWAGIIDQGTAQSASGTGLVLRAAAAFADDTLVGATLLVFGSTQGYWQTRQITDNALSGDSVTVDPAWTVTPSGTITYKILAGPPTSTVAPVAANVTQFGGVNGTFSSGRPEVNTSHVSGTLQTAGDIISRLPAALVSGRIDASVGAMAANVMTAAAAAADLTTELQSGLATASALSTVDGKIDAIGNFVDTEVAAIKAVTDKLDGMVENTSDGWIWTLVALQNAPSGGASAADIADAVWEEAIADHSGTSGSTAEALAAAGSAGDPWITALPGSYSAGQAGKIVGDFLNASISSRATQTSVDDLPTNAELATALDPLPTAAENASAVWGAGARTLTALDEDSTTLDIDATVRAAVGLASANLDTQLAPIPDIDLRGERTVVRGTAAGGASTTSIPTSAFSPAGAAADQFKGRIVVFDNDTATVALRGQATDITASTNSATPTLTVTALTTAPASGDTFSVL